MSREHFPSSSPRGQAPVLCTPTSEMAFWCFGGRLAMHDRLARIGATCCERESKGHQDVGDRSSFRLPAGSAVSMSRTDTPSFETTRETTSSEPGPLPLLRAGLSATLQAVFQLYSACERLQTPTNNAGSCRVWRSWIGGDAFATSNACRPRSAMGTRDGKYGACSAIC